MHHNEALKARGLKPTDWSIADRLLQNAAIQPDTYYDEEYLNELIHTNNKMNAILTVSILATIDNDYQGTKLGKVLLRIANNTHSDLTDSGIQKLVDFIEAN